jgi:hypothetical protein
MLIDGSPQPVGDPTYHDPHFVGVPDTSLPGLTLP